MIPQVINYCWFGENKKPKVIEKCMESWRKFCPNYEIVEWNESNFDINCCDYVKEAYNARKWAFVSDYARFYILNKFGGIYLDTDVELIKPLDSLLTGNFTGFESSESVATGLIMGATPNNELCARMLEQYDSEHFIVDGAPNMRTVCDRVTDVLVSEGLKLEDSTQNVLDYTIYNSRYFNPYDMDTAKIIISPETMSIHRYAATWVAPKDRFRGKVFQCIARIFGVNFARKIQKIVGRK